MEDSCSKCGKNIAHTEDYCFMRISKKYYQFCKECLEKYITDGAAEAWLVAVIL